MRHYFDFDTLREIGDSLFRNRRRTILTGFGIFWGLFMLLFLVGGGNGLKSVLSETFEGFASNTMVLVSSNTSKPYKGMKEGRYWQLTRRDVERLKVLMPELDVVAPMVSNWGQTAYYKGNTTNPGVKGISGDYCKIEQPLIKYGRTISDADVEQERKVCVIGKRIYNDLFPEGGDPCGEFIRVGSVFKDSYVSVYFDDVRVSHRKKKIMAPGEMEQIVLQKKQLLAAEGLKTITVRIEAE